MYVYVCVNAHIWERKICYLYEIGENFAFFKNFESSTERGEKEILVSKMQHYQQSENINISTPDKQQLLNFIR